MNHGKHRHSKQTCYEPQAPDRDAVRKKSREREREREGNEEGSRSQSVQGGTLQDHSEFMV